MTLVGLAFPCGILKLKVSYLIKISTQVSSEVELCQICSQQFPKKKEKPRCHSLRLKNRLMFNAVFVFDAVFVSACVVGGEGCEKETGRGTVCSEGRNQLQ